MAAPAAATPAVTVKLNAAHQSKASASEVLLRNLVKWS